MSAPKTNIEKQRRWHRGPLLGMAAVIIFVGLMFMWLTGAFGPDEPSAPVPTEQGGAPTADGVSPDAPAVPSTPDAPTVPADPVVPTVPAVPPAPASN